MKRSIKKSIVDYYRDNFKPKRFIPGKSLVPVSGKVFDAQEMLGGVEAVLDGWWTEGRFTASFEKEFSKYLGIKYVTLVNSGSSANLVALTALTSPVFGERALKPGDEVVTVATGFPTTVNPILQNQLVAVATDNDLVSKNATVENLASAITPKTRAIMIAHTLGNPLPIAGIMKLVEKYKLWFIEDCCDALGATYNDTKVGNFGHIATFSFYPAHQITMGEGGAIVTKNPLIHQSIRQFRDWGRDCWCDTGKDDTCRRRFKWQLGELPYGYDHKYIYSRVGYNLKLTDMQAAIGLAQLAKLPQFVEKRRKNFNRLLAGLTALNQKKYLIFSAAQKDASPSWFGFPIVVSDDAPFAKLEFVGFLEDHKIATRSIFAGNLLKHPAYMGRSDIRPAGPLPNSDLLTTGGLWIGVFPGISDEIIDYVIKTVGEFLKDK